MDPSTTLPPPNSSLPLLVIFGLDYTLWPFWLDTEAKPPFSKNQLGHVVDRTDKVLQLYEDVPRILDRLKKAGIRIGITSHNVEMRGTMELVTLFGLDKYISFSEMFLPYKKDQIERMRLLSNIKYSDMLFFDDWDRNIKMVSTMGVFGVLVTNGMNMKVLDDSFQLFAERKIELEKIRRSGEPE